MHAPIGIMSYDEINCIYDIIMKNPMTIEQIAVAQSRICRYGGRGCHHYSDAQHAVMVSMMVPQERKYILQALMHDAHEIHTGDMVGPFKREIKKRTTWLKDLEDYAQKLFLNQVGIDYPIYDCVERADKSICRYEMDGLEYTGKIEFESEIGHISTFFWSAEKAEREFLKIFYQWR